LIVKYQEAKQMKKIFRELNGRNPNKMIVKNQKQLFLKGNEVRGVK